MWLLYLDESGVPEGHASQTTHYVQLGLAIYEGSWYALQKQIRGVKGRFALGDKDDLELHAAWLFRRYAEQEKISGFDNLSRQARRDAVLELRQEYKDKHLGALKPKDRRDKLKYFRETDSSIHLTREERADLVDAALDVVAKYRKGRSLHLFGEAISKPHLSAAIDPVQEAFEQVVMRFEKFLRSRRDRTWGMIVADHDEHKADRFSNTLKRFQSSGGPLGSVDRVIESPFFLDSAQSSGVQVADLCAYVLRRYVENGEARRFLPILPKFYQTPTHLYGLRHFIPRGECACKICELKGRT